MNTPPLTPIEEFAAQNKQRYDEFNQEVVVVDVPEAQHSGHGPSGADTWVLCPGAHEAQKPFPDTDNQYSLRGTACHQLLEWVVTEALPAVPQVGIYEVPVTLVDGSVQQWPLNQEDFKATQMAVDFVNEQRTPDCQFAAEHRTDPGPMCQGDDMWGTMDLRFYYPAARYLHVADYKNGRDSKDAKDSRQLLLYTIGEADALIRAGYPVDTVRMTILQPNRNDGKHWMQSIEMPIGELWAWVPIFTAARAASGQPDAPRIPGEAQCKWCRASGTPACPESGEKFISEVTQVNQSLTGEKINIPAAPELLSPTQLATACSYFKACRTWMDKVEAYMLEQSQQGVAFVDSTGTSWGPIDTVVRRRWSFDDEEIMKKLSNRLRTVNKDLSKEDKLTINLYRGHNLLSFTQVLNNIQSSVLGDEAKGKLIQVVQEELIEKPIAGKKLGKMPSVVTAAPQVTEEIPAAVVPSFLL